MVGTHLLSLHTYGSQGITGVLAGESDRDIFGWWLVKDVWLVLVVGVSVVALPVAFAL